MPFGLKIIEHVFRIKICAGIGLILLGLFCTLDLDSGTFFSEMQIGISDRIGGTLPYTAYAAGQVAGISLASVIFPSLFALFALKRRAFVMVCCAFIISFVLDGIGFIGIALIVMLLRKSSREYFKVRSEEGSLKGPAVRPEPHP